MLLVNEILSCNVLLYCFSVRNTADLKTETVKCKDLEIGKTVSANLLKTRNVKTVVRAFKVEKYSVCLHSRIYCH